MTVALRGVRHDSDVLIEQLDSRLARLRAGRGPGGPPAAPAGDLAAAEPVATQLRQPIAECTQASAADRARVRAAVHYFLGRGRRSRTIADNVRVVNEIIGDLGRPLTLDPLRPDTPVPPA